jgi:hypothetical protein
MPCAAAAGSLRSLAGVRAQRYGQPCGRAPQVRGVAVMGSTSGTSQLIFTDQARVKAKRAALIAGGLKNLQVRAHSAHSWSVCVCLRQKMREPWASGFGEQRPRVRLGGTAGDRGLRPHVNDGKGGERRALRQQPRRGREPVSTQRRVQGGHHGPNEPLLPDRDLLRAHSRTEDPAYGTMVRVERSALKGRKARRSPRGLCWA